MDNQQTAVLATSLDTPCVTILLDRLEKNIERGQRIITAAGKRNRPHVKTHKIPAIGAMQIAAGASGLTCQKLGEAEVFIDAAVTDDILITFNIVGPSKTGRLVDLSERISRLSVVADNDVVARGISDAAVARGRQIPILVECDTGFGRNGVQSPEQALDLARAIERLPGATFGGLLVYPNNAPNTGAFFTAALELFAKAGMPVPIVSGGGSPALLTVDDYPMMTEHRAGTYVYNDVMMVESGLATWDDCAMHVRTTIVSRPTEDRGVIDAGSKVLTRERYFVKNFGHVVEYPEAVLVNVSEEHGVVDFAKCAKKPMVGEVISVVPNHCCVVSNMVDEVYGLRNGAVEVVWPVAARGLVR